jgi:hypothetical protein
MPDQKIADVAVAQAAARAAAADAARHKAAPPHTHRKGNDLLTAAIVAVLLIGTLAFAIFANR